MQQLCLWSLLGIEVHCLIELIKNLFLVANLSIRWPHLVADSEAFLDQPPLAAGFSSGLWGVFLPHNEHRLVVSRLLHVLPPAFGYPEGSWSVVVSFLLIFASLFLFNKCLSIFCSSWSLGRVVVVLAGALVLFNPWQSENLIWAINVHWFLQGLIIIASMLVLLRSDSSQEVAWIDIFLPVLALLNGGQGYAVILAYGAARLIVFGRRYVFLMGVAGAIALQVFLPSIRPGPDGRYGFSFEFLQALVGLWWPMSVLVLVFSFGLIAVGFVRLRRESGFKFDSAWLIVLMPLFYSVLFGLMVVLSRSEFGISMAFRQSYVTPLSFGLLSLLLLAWRAFASGLGVLWPLLQSAFIVVPLVVVPSPALKSGFHRPNFFRMQRNMIAEINRRISWDHCIAVEGEIGLAPSNCLFSNHYEAHGGIRRARPKWSLDSFEFAGGLSPSQASERINDSRSGISVRTYIMRNSKQASPYLVLGRPIELMPGDHLIEISSEGSKKAWRIHR